MSVTVTLTYCGEIVKVYHGNAMAYKIIHDWSKLYPKHLFEKCIIDIKKDTPIKIKKVENPSIIPVKINKKKISGGISLGGNKGHKTPLRRIDNQW